MPKRNARPNFGLSVNSSEGSLQSRAFTAIASASARVRLVLRRKHCESLDYLEGGTVGGIYGEGLKGVSREVGAGDMTARDWQKYWKKGEWNHIRTRIEGAIPHIQVWMNGYQIVDWTDAENHLADGATEGMIAVQVHRTDPKARKGQRWIRGSITGIGTSP